MNFAKPDVSRGTGFSWIPQQGASVRPILKFPL
jgi:hypothetical protein